MGHGSRRGVDRPLRRRAGGFAAISFRSLGVCLVLLLAVSLAAATARAQSPVPAAGQAKGQGQGQEQEQQQEQQPSIRVIDSAQVFATLCALYAAGYSVVPANASGPLKELALQLGTLHGPAVTALRAFYRTHRLSSNSATLARYVSFAMVVGPPPAFQYTFPANLLPPDVRDLDGFQKLLGDFYVEEKIGSLWQRVEPYYRARTVRLRGPVSELVTVATAYARRIKPFPADRTFTVYVDPLVGSVTNFRIYSQSYKIAVNPDSPDALRDIRVAFLHYLLDPLTFNNSAVIESKKDLFNFAVHAPRLPDAYRRDFVAFTDECLVRAVALRLGSLSAAAREAALKQDDSDGYILVRPLYTGLQNYENSLGSLADYFPRLIASIDVKAEATRDQKIVFAAATTAPPAPPETEANRLRQWLALGDRQIAAQDAAGAAETFASILQLDPGNAKAEYGLAVASAMSGRAGQASQLFQKAANSSTADASTKAWSYVFLGRMNDLAGRRQDALVQYRAALAIAGIPPTARAAAEQGIKQAFAAGKSDPGATRRH